jgi:hypothetical protein
MTGFEPATSGFTGQRSNHLSYIHRAGFVILRWKKADLCFGFDHNGVESENVARPARVELATTRLEGGCSIQLSYGRTV